MPNHEKFSVANMTKINCDFRWLGTFCSTMHRSLTLRVLFSIFIGGVGESSAAPNNPPNDKSVLLAQARADTASSPTSSLFLTPQAAQTQMQISTAEYYSLQKLAIYRELEQTVIQSLQTKFWIALFIIIAVGWFGIRALVREFVQADLKEAMRATADAQAASSLAKDSIKEVRAEAGKYKELVEGAAETASQVNTKLTELRSRIESEGERSVAAADIKIKGLAQQIGELKIIVDALARESDHKGFIDQTNERMTHAKQESSIKEAKFTENAATGVLVVVPGKEMRSQTVNALASSLSKKGYRVAKSAWNDGYKPRGTIRIVHKPDFLAAAREIRKIVALESAQQSDSIKLDSQLKPIQGSPEEVVVFFD